MGEGFPAWKAALLSSLVTLVVVTVITVPVTYYSRPSDIPVPPPPPPTPNTEKCHHEANNRKPPPTNTVGNPQYDFIVVGGGTGGAVVATRLAENPNLRVLVIESGADITNDTVNDALMRELFGLGYCVGLDCPADTLPLHMSSTPFMVAFVLMTGATYQYTSVPMLHANKKENNYIRGHTLGGSSAVNFMCPMRGLKSDFDNWNLTGWDYESVLPFFKKSENWTIDDDTTYHGHNGPICHTKVSDHLSFPAWEHIAEVAVTEMGLPRTKDFSSVGEEHGVADMPSMVCPNGKRSSSLDYLEIIKLAGRLCIDKPHSECGANQNLHIWTRKFVTNLEYDPASPKRVVGVSYLDANSHPYLAKTYHPDFDLLTEEGLKYRVPYSYFNNSQRPEQLQCPSGSFTNDINQWYIPPRPDPQVLASRTSKVYASKEVILAAGVFNTPQIMMLSGIGPKKHISDALDIPLVADLPVGENLYDHHEIDVIFEFPANYTPPWNPATDVPTMIGKWLSGQPGAFSSNHVPGGIDISTNPEDNIPELHMLWAGFFVESLSYNEWVTTNPRLIIPRTAGDIFTWEGLKYYSWVVANVHPCGSGYVKLKSTDPLVVPFIDLGVGMCNSDIDDLLYGIKFVRDLNSRLNDTYRGTEVMPGPEYQTDDQIRNWIRSQLWSHQACCTAPMGNCPGEDGKAVVDNRGRVFKVEGLRVADISVLPSMIRGNPSLQVFMLAEKISQHILEDYGLAN